jgi:general secretion pathway protein C
MARRRYLWGLVAAISVAGGWLVVMAVASRLESQRHEAAEQKSGRAQQPAPVVEREPAAAPAAGTAYRLIGTVVASDARWSRATIAGPQGKAALYRIGEQLPGGAELRAIGDDWAALRISGERIVIRLEAQQRRAAAAGSGADTAEKAGRVAEPSPAAGAPLPGVRRATDRVWRIERRALEDGLQQRDALLNQARFSLVFDPGGVVRGLRIGLPADAGPFGQLGLRDGDVLLRVGSIEIDGPDVLADLPALLAQATEVELELERRGRRLLLRYFIDDR